MSKKFFLISQVFYPDEVSTAGLFTSLCSVMAKDNLEIEVWCAQPSYSAQKRQPKQILYNGIRILYLPSTNFHKDNIAGRILNIITFSTSAFIKLLFSNGKCSVFTHTTPPSLGIFVSLACAVRKRKFVYILLDILPYGLIRLGKVSSRNLAIRFWHRLFIYTLKHSNKIIVLGRDMKAWLGDIYPESLDKVEYIPHWQDDKLIFPVDFLSNEYIIQYKLKDKFVIQYSGNMGIWNDMETLGKAALEKTGNVAFMFVGGGVRKNELMRVVSERNLNDILFLPFQPFEKLGSLLSACHVALVSLREGLEGMAVPCKIYGILAAGVPVIAVVPESSEIAMIVREENCGMVVKPGDPASLNNAIEFMKNNESARLEMGRNGGKAFKNKYAVSIIAGRYKLLINSLAEF